MKVDYVVVGSGLTGAVMARMLVDAGREVIVLERRSHVGGNLHDHVHPSGIRIHTYGPHYFRTNSEKIWRFVDRFGKFCKYEAVLKTLVEGQYENWPVAASYIRRVIGDSWEPAFRGRPTNFEEASLAMMPRLIYERFVRGYTEKQWGVAADRLSVELAGRFDVREDDEPRLKRQRYQGIPLEGYSSFMSTMLAGIPVLLSFDYLKDREAVSARKLLIFTGPIDEYFDFDLGRLAYRGQLREHEYLPDIDCLLPCGQVNNPDPANGAHIRTLEWKHMMPQVYSDRIHGSVLTKETTISPTDPNNYEYPFPDSVNAALYRQYRQRADAIPHLLICGRLGEYCYYDMDQAIARALLLARRIVTGDDIDRE